MRSDGYSYPVESYIWFQGKKCYSYQCENCGIIIRRYYHKRIKGHILCYTCRAKLYTKKGI